MAKVMLVEDDNNLREIYEARLQAEGYTIVSAKDGEEALVVAKQEKPDLIISDVMMPKISGFEMLDILRNTDELKATKVVMLTALGQTDDQQRADKLGADRYLVKSQVTLEDIVKVAHDLLEDGAPAIPAAPAAAPVAPPTSPLPTSPAPADPPVAPPSVPPADPPVAAQVPPVPSVSAPAPTPVPTDDSANNMAQTTAQEEASVDAQIENFVEGATTEATPAIAAEPAAPPSPEVISGVAGQGQAAAAADDKLMAEAVKTLETAAQAEAEPEAVVPPSAPAEPVTAPPLPETAVVTPASEKPQSDAVTVAHKKVIQPIDSNPKQDIASLVALEEAKEAAAAPPPPPIATIATADHGPTAQPLGAIQKTSLGTPTMPAEPTAAPTASDLEQPSGSPSPAPHQADAKPGDSPAADDPNAIAL